MSDNVERDRKYSGKKSDEEDLQTVQKLTVRILKGRK